MGAAGGADPRRWPMATAGFRTRLGELELEYVLAVQAETSVYGPETTFAVPPRKGTVGRRRSGARPDRRPESVRSLAERLPAEAWTTLPCRATLADAEVRSRFAFVRVVATHPVRTDCLPAAPGVADRRVAGARGVAERLLALQPRRR